jgi:hypothetical protein
MYLQHEFPDQVDSPAVAKVIDRGIARAKGIATQILMYNEGDIVDGTDAD